MTDMSSSVFASIPPFAAAVAAAKSLVRVPAEQALAAYLTSGRIEGINGSSGSMPSGSVATSIVSSSPPNIARSAAAQFRQKPLLKKAPRARG
jgi:hypothetical protein